MRFKKGTTSKQAYEVIMHDIGCLELKNTKDNEYHMRLIKENLKDIFGIEEKKEGDDIVEWGDFL